MKRLNILLILLLVAAAISAQPRKKIKKDSLQVMPCMLENAKEPPVEKLSYDPGVTELKLEIVSDSDTVLKAPVDATVSIIQRDENGTTEIVFFHDDYYFWVSGITRADVYKNKKVKKGDKLGFVAPGKKIEILLYDFETPMDPKKYFECGLSGDKVEGPKKAVPGN